jgi:hypothetical protein
VDVAAEVFKSIVEIPCVLGKLRRRDFLKAFLEDDLLSFIAF